MTELAEGSVHQTSYDTFDGFREEIDHYVASWVGELEREFWEKASEIDLDVQVIWTDSDRTSVDRIKVNDEPGDQYFWERLTEFQRSALDGFAAQLAVASVQRKIGEKMERDRLKALEPDPYTYLEELFGHKRHPSDSISGGNFTDGEEVVRAYEFSPVDGLNITIWRDEIELVENDNVSTNPFYIQIALEHKLSGHLDAIEEIEIRDVEGKDHRRHHPLFRLQPTKGAKLEYFDRELEDFVELQGPSHGLIMQMVKGEIPAAESRIKFRPLLDRGFREIKPEGSTAQ